MLAEFADPNAMENWQSPILSMLDARQQPQVSVAAILEAIDKISDQGRNKGLREAHLERLAVSIPWLGKPHSAMVPKPEQTWQVKEQNKGQE